MEVFLETRSTAGGCASQRRRLLKRSGMTASPSRPAAAKGRSAPDHRRHSMGTEANPGFDLAVSNLSSGPYVLVRTSLSLGGDRARQTRGTNLVHYRPTYLSNSTIALGIRTLLRPETPTGDRTPACHFSGVLERTRKVWFEHWAGALQDRHVGTRRHNTLFGSSTYFSSLHCCCSRPADNVWRVSETFAQVLGPSIALIQ